MKGGEKTKYGHKEVEPHVHDDLTDERRKSEDNPEGQGICDEISHSEV